MSTAKLPKREDNLPLERAQRALEDVHQSLKDFSTTETVKANDVFAAELKAVRRKAKKLRKRLERLTSLCGSTLEAGS